MNNTYWDSWIQPATYDDARFIYRLRNEPHIAKESTKGMRIEYADHVAWSEKVMLDGGKCFPFVIMRQQKCSNCHIPIAEKEKIGHVRFDNSDRDYASVSIFLRRRAQQQGMGSGALKDAILKYYAGCKFFINRFNQSGSDIIHLVNSLDSNQE